MTNSPLENKRLERLRRLGAKITHCDRQIAVDESRPWIAIVSSRLGQDLKRRERICQFLDRCAEDARRKNARWLIASDSAIEPWAIRAAQLYQVPYATISGNPDQRTASIHCEPIGTTDLNRDRLVISIADRIDAAYVRRRGTIANALLDRLRGADDNIADMTLVRVAVSAQSSPRPNCAAGELIANGAVGWYPYRTNEDANMALAPPLESIACTDGSDRSWMNSTGQWLLHCTRGQPGPWPDQIGNQFLDEALLATCSATARTPIDTLCRILRSGRLLANSITTARDYPVVCFSANPLNRLLARRCFRQHLGRWDYEPFGIAIAKRAAENLGMQPVIYGDHQTRRSLSETDLYRFQPTGKTHNWTEEQEWRSRHNVELYQLPPSDWRVFALHTAESREKLARFDVTITWLHDLPAN